MSKSAFKSASRQQESLLAPLEKKTLIWLAHRMPGWVNSDHLTILGFLGMVMAGVCYYLARLNPLAIVAAVVFLGLNWFGDSLDGTLARVRDKQRPRYGFYVDHIVDSFGAIFLIGGLGMSGYMTGTIALVLIIAYFLLAIELYLATYTIGIFRLSFSIWGPTELRIVLAIGSFVLLYKPIVTVAGRQYLLCDVSGVIAIISLTAIAIINSIRNTIRLYREERIP
ncbi:MAG TPA: CDP-alcohol phosphatidyltransferase family protein [Terriglobia bacterium]|nr:CDP-alcohol phosphatidyltransferase family protein [Terriglobia bacterium]